MPVKGKSGQHNLPAVPQTGKQKPTSQEDAGLQGWTPERKSDVDAKPIQHRSGELRVPDQSVSSPDPAPDPPRTGELQTLAPRERFRFALKKRELLLFAILVLFILVTLLVIAYTQPAYRLVSGLILLILGLVLFFGGNAVLVESASKSAPRQARLCRYLPFLSLLFLLLYWRKLSVQPVAYLCGIVFAIAGCTVLARGSRRKRSRFSLAKRRLSRNR
jgi:hypothetical protein